MLIRQLSLHAYTSVQFIFFWCTKVQCCNLQSVYIRSLQFIFSVLRLLVVERVSTTGSESPLYFLARLLTPVLYWCRRQCDLSHLTSTEEDSAGSSQQLVLSARAK